MIRALEAFSERCWGLGVLLPQLPTRSQRIHAQVLEPGICTEEARVRVDFPSNSAPHLPDPNPAISMTQFAASDLNDAAFSTDGSAWYSPSCGVGSSFPDQPH